MLASTYSSSHSSDVVGFCLEGTDSNIDLF